MTTTQRAAKHLIDMCVKHKVIAIDPGETTGVVVFNARSQGREPYVNYREFSREQMYDFIARVNWAEHTVVTEKWIIYPHMMNRLAFNECIAARVIGALEMQCCAAKKSIHFQHAKDAKEMNQNIVMAVVTQLGGPPPSFGHAFDALRHALLFASKIPLANIDSDPAQRVQ
jgi:hypothetical protein